MATPVEKQSDLEASMVLYATVGGIGKKGGLRTFRGFFRKIYELSHKTMIIKERLVVVNEGVRPVASQGICALGCQLFVLLHLEFYRFFLLLGETLVLFLFIFQLLFEGQGTLALGFWHLLVEEGSILLVPFEYYLGGWPLDMQEFGCPGDGKALIQHHFDESDSFLRGEGFTSVEILEYLFLCLAFYSISLIFLLLIILRKFNYSRLIYSFYATFQNAPFGLPILGGGGDGWGRNGLK